ncbi:hypothetical protein NB311A_08053 [Nitrobacter sp. Nb-311A]|uniref:hypothetical protein n=1 Tax=unclassified Nitrobacter TaxID=2620411 RepID=UPI0000684B2E|nr:MULTISPECIES: hypothetical protein [unclassified Nitrobacter]EAQ37087.1 hypothetical protein NB311A_08053 [Nitrobacter sp. Nb-311A]MCB1393525.1 hypothetical protein [Nitrobacter sp.]MCV0386787.1 hypothetical protein [Nitrobacter sp.]
MFAALLYALPYIVGGAMCLLVLIGFWRGLSLRPHKDGYGSRRGIHWWYGPRD